MDSADPVTGQQGRPAVPSAPAEVWRGTFALPVAPAVAAPRPPRDRIWFRQTAAKLLRAPFTRETGRQVEFAVLGLLLAIPGFVFVPSPSPSAWGCRSVSLACWSGCRC